MKTTYRAMQVSQPGVLELVERQTPTPSPDEVLIEVQACGMCGADVADIERPNMSSALPRVPGHEVVGRIVALGSHVLSNWQLGQRVGVGRLGGHCNVCDQCRQGHFQRCSQQPAVGASRDGGYAEMMLALATGLVSIPEELDAEQAAPILCAGLATFNALKKCGAQAGDTVAVVGIGGLGHMALQYAHKMGFKVVAVGRGADIAQSALALGAHVYIDSRQQDAAAALQALDGAHAIVSTIADVAAINALITALTPGGRLMLLGVGKDPLPLPLGATVSGERSVMGSITGSPYDNERALQFSVLAGVRPHIEVMALAQANEAYKRMKSGAAQYRMVLTMG